VSFYLVLSIKRKRKTAMLLNKLTKILFVCTPFLFLASTPSQADVFQTEKMEVDINLEIKARCTIKTSKLHFGTIHPGRKRTKEIKIYVTCSNSKEKTCYSFSMDQGKAYDDKGKQRRMKLTKDTKETISYIRYDLWYLEENRFLTPLHPDHFFRGDCSDPTSFITIQGKAFAKEDEAKHDGLHTDEVTVTITY
jgi:spore coat protein U-like protein